MLVDDQHIHLRQIRRRLLLFLRFGDVAVADRRQRMEDFDLAQRVRHEHLAARIRQSRAHRRLERRVDQRRMQDEFLETHSRKRRDLQRA